MPSIVRLTNQKKSKKEPPKVLTREMNDSKIKELNSVLAGVNWNCILNPMDADESFNHFHMQLKEACEKVIPLKMKMINHNWILRDPWLTNSLHSCLIKKKCLYKDTLLSESVEKLDKYKTYRNTLQKLIRYCKSQYCANKCAEFKNDRRNCEI